MTISIGQLAHQSGVNAPTIRYYESIGLLRPPLRKPSGHRAYGAEDEDRLTFIRRCRAFGFSIDEVKTLVAVTQSAERSCFEARDLAEDHLTTLRATLVELRTLEKRLLHFVQDCKARCAGGPGKSCEVLNDLSRAKSYDDAAGNATNQHGNGRHLLVHKSGKELSDHKEENNIQTEQPTKIPGRRVDRPAVRE